MDRPSNEQIALWYPRLLRTALRMTGSVEDAADLAQSAFCKALGCWDQFDGKALPTTWLHSILVNCVRDWARDRSGRDGRSSEPWALAVVPDRRGGIAEQVEQKEKIAQLRLEIERLPERLRQVFIAVVLDGYTYQETAELLSIPSGTVGSRVSDAHRQLRQAMQRKFSES